MKHAIYTIGYEGHDVAQVVATLKALNITLLADVRELPLSRKAGLSKTPLKTTLAANLIEYRHFRALGDPKSGRMAARSGEFQKFARIYRDHFYRDVAQSEFSELLDLARKNTVCMMCFERCAHLCHRSYIADEASRHGFTVYNLVVDHREQYQQNDTNIPRYYPRQGLSAAE